MREGYFEKVDGTAFPAVFIKQSIRCKGFPEDGPEAKMNNRVCECSLSFCLPTHPVHQGPGLREPSLEAREMNVRCVLVRSTITADRSQNTNR